MDSPPPTPTSKTKEYKNIYYNCTQFSSLIEILSINEENNKIEFKCCNDEHEKQTMKIKIYLDKMKFNNKEQLIKIDVKFMKIININIIALIVIAICVRNV